MYDLRFRFEKRGTAAYLSHLDLMRCLQRSFVRAGIPVKYSQGFNPHIEMSILAPLSTGYETVCDLCDLQLAGEQRPEDFARSMNEALPRGLRVTGVGPAARPAREIAFFAYDIALPQGDAAAMAALFSRPVTVDKRSKRGVRQVDLLDYIREIAFLPQGEGTVCRCTVAAGNDPLNPVYLTQALKTAGLVPEDATAGYLRRAILDEEGQNFQDFSLQSEENCAMIYDA